MVDSPCEAGKIHEYLQASYSASTKKGREGGREEKGSGHFKEPI